MLTFTLIHDDQWSRQSSVVQYLLWRDKILHSVKYCTPRLNTSVGLSTWLLVSAIIFEHEQYWTALDQNMTVSNCMNQAYQCQFLIQFIVNSLLVLYLIFI